MTMLILEFLGAALTIFIAGTFLTRYADAIGQRTGLGRTLAGMVLLATATSLPELTVGCNLARMGQANLAVGDLLGAALFNLLILAVLDLVQRSPARMLSQIGAAHALSATMCIAMLAICLIAMLVPSDFTLAGIGPGPLMIGVTYVLGLRLVYFDQRFALERMPESNDAGNELENVPSLNRSAFGYVAATLAILIAAPLLASAAEELSVVTGLGGTFIGTTLLAIVTTLPELVTTTSAVRSGAFDLAVGNVFGSITFNLVILLPVDTFYEGSLLASASPTHAVTAACVILVTSVAVAGLLYRPDKRYWIIEPDALLVIVLVLVSLGLVYHLR